MESWNLDILFKLSVGLYFKANTPAIRHRKALQQCWFLLG